MLEGVDVSAAAERVYRALLRDPTSSPACLAAQADVAGDEVAERLDELVRLGLVQRLPQRSDRNAWRAPQGPRWRPLDPRVAVAALVRQRQETLDRALRGADELVVDFTDGMLRSRRSQLAEVIDGAQRVVAALLDLTARATGDVAVLDAPPYLDVVASAAAERSLITRGVRSRAVYATAAIDLPGRLEPIQQMIAAGEQARVLPAVPLKLVVVDGERALLPLSVRGGQVTSAILVHPSMLAHALHALFEALWTRALPLPLDTAAPTGELDATDRELLVLLGTGIKDEAIARQLGVSARTLGRRITRLLTRLGASSRFQAGIQANRRGWL